MTAILGAESTGRSVCSGSSHDGVFPRHGEARPKRSGPSPTRAITPSSHGHADLMLRHRCRWRMAGADGGTIDQGETSHSA